MNAADSLLDRGFGRSTQLIEHDVHETFETPYSGLTTQQLEALIQITDQLTPEQIQAMIDRETRVIDGEARILEAGPGA